MNNPVGIMFDCDGTLLDSMVVWREVEDELARRAGVELSQTDTDEITTLTIPECGLFFHEHFGLGESGADVVGMIDRMMLDFYRNRAEERPGALSFVQSLADRGVRMSVVSSSPQAYLQAGLARCGFMPYLDAVVSVDDVGASKRESTVWDHARAIMGTPREFTWGMEDSAYAVRTLRDAGYRTIGIYDCDLSGTYEELADQADCVIRAFAELDAEGFLALA